MNGIHPKIPRVPLDPIAYKNLRQEVLRRDCWRCQSCGTMSNLEVHHRELRTHLGDDSERKLITLWTACTPVCIVPHEELLISCNVWHHEVRNTSQVRSGTEADKHARHLCLWPFGVNKNAWVWPLIVPIPTIWPHKLIA